MKLLNVMLSLERLIVDWGELSKWNWDDFERAELKRNRIRTTETEFSWF